MQSISTIGLDVAKSVFQVHRVDATGQIVIRRQPRRRHVLAFFLSWDSISRHIYQETPMISDHLGLIKMSRRTQLSVSDGVFGLN